MRRVVLCAVAGSVGLLWVWLARPAPPRPAPQRAKPARAAERRPTADRPTGRPLEVSWLSGRGLCGTEIPPPGGEPGPGVPAALKDLSVGVPTAERIEAAVDEWGFDSGEELGPGAAARDAARGRTAIATRLERARADRDDPDTAEVATRVRAERLRDLGRPGEALSGARYAYARWPSSETVTLMAALLDDVGQTAEARRILELERGRTEDDGERAWIDAQLGFVAATRGDPAGAARAVAALEAQSEEPSLAPFTRAVQLTFLGRVDEARAAYERALENERDFASLNNLAEIEVCSGRTDESRRLYREAHDRRAAPDATASTLGGLAYAHLRDGDLVPAWLYASAALAGTGDGSHSSGPRGVLALSALTAGDLGEARTQARLARAANPHDDLVMRRCFADPAERAAMQALAAEARGDRTAAQAAWLEVARGGHQALSLAARHALRELCS